MTNPIVIAQISSQQLGATNPTPESTQEVSIEIPCYFGYHLKLGDKDSIRKWGGETRTTEGNWVKDLQTDLKEFNLFDGSTNGTFDASTERSLKFFQWVSKNWKNRLVNNMIIESSVSFLVNPQELWMK